MTRQYQQRRSWFRRIVITTIVTAAIGAVVSLFVTRMFDKEMRLDAEVNEHPAGNGSEIEVILENVGGLGLTNVGVRVWINAFDFVLKDARVSGGDCILERKDEEHEGTVETLMVYWQCDLINPDETIFFNHTFACYDRNGTAAVRVTARTEGYTYDRFFEFQEVWAKDCG